MKSLNDIIDLYVHSNNRTKNREDLQTPIHNDIFFRYNSVNLVIGKRQSGKTYSTLREILKLPLVLGEQNKYTQIYYITDKHQDDTVEMFKPVFEKLKFMFNWINTSDAEVLINSLSELKADISSGNIEDDVNAYYELLNCRPDQTPHTIIIFDDCIGLFSKASSLSKKLFENRQSRITYFLLLQDVQGISPSMKANIDSLTLFGGFPKHKFTTLFYQLPPVDLDFDTYARLSTQDAVRIDYIESSVKILTRNKNDFRANREDYDNPDY